jgi:predicted nuclease of predicted toxin-antitoxin system
MKLLLDANLSYRLVKQLQPHYAEVKHVPASD